MIYKRCNVWL